MVLVQNLKFLHCFLLGTFLLEKVFADVLYRKLAFFKHKNIALKKSQNLHFFPKFAFFWSKITTCFIFSFWQIWWLCKQKTSLPQPIKHRFKGVARFEFFKSGQSIVFVKNFKFLQCFLLGTFITKKCLVTFYIENQPILTIKTLI